MSKKENDLPIWFSWLMTVSLMLFIYFIVKFESDKQHKKDQEYIIKSFSRMSESKAIQDAYNELHPLKEDEEE